jgi:GT2 family glycosyltransferase
VDNASPDGSAALVAQAFPSVRVISLQENLGFGPACNVGVAASTGPFILLLNPDAVASPDGVLQLINFMEQNCPAGIAGACLTDPSGSRLRSMGDRPTIFSIALDRLLVLPARVAGRRGKLRKLIGALSAKYRLPDQPQRVAWVSGAALCCRRQAWEQLGGFDENFFMYYEDVDLCLRAADLGWETWHLPEVTIEHQSGASWQGNETLRKDAFYRSQRYFFKKHGGTFSLAVIKGIQVIYRMTRATSRMLKKGCYLAVDAVYLTR